MTLEQSGILSAETRELVIDRALAASGDTLSLEQLKLVVLMVVWNQQMPTSRLLAEDLFSAPQARLPS
jgi:Smg protein